MALDEETINLLADKAGSVENLHGLVRAYEDGQKRILIREQVVDATRVRRWLADGTAREMRERAGLSMNEAATALGVSFNAIRSWEHGLRRPRVEVAARYGALLRAVLDEDRD